MDTTGSRSGSGSKASRSGNSAQGNGVVGSVKQVASKAKGPAIAVAGATAAGIAGGLALKGRHRRRHVLGVPMPRSLSSGVDVKSVAKSVGKASQKVAEASKTVSKDADRVGDQAERIGKILG